MAASSAPGWRDWYIFGMRWFVIACFTLLTVSTQTGFMLAGGNLAALLVAVIANIVFAAALLLRVRTLSNAAIVLTDWVIAGALVWLTRGNPLLSAGAATSMTLLTLLRPNALYSVVSAAGTVALLPVLLILSGAVPSIQDLLGGDLRIPVLETLLWAFIVILSAYALERQTFDQTRSLAELAAAKSEQLADARERSRAIYEMTMTFSETQHFERILNAALDAGQLGLRGRMGKDLAAAVLLFQTEEPGLRVIAARKFTRADMTHVPLGREGIIGEALREASPIIGGRGKDDPELRYFTGMHNVRSTLCVPLRAGYDNFGVLLYGSDTANAFTQEHSELLTSIGVQATIALQNYILYQTLLEEKDRIARVAEDERKQLARQLHDGPTQKVSHLAMMTSIIFKMLEKAPDQIPDELRKMEEIARSTTKEMRHMLFTLRPLVLEEQGMTAALEQLAEKMRETHGQNVSVRVQPGMEDILDRQKQAVVFYLIEEAINNARKHAQASLIKVEIKAGNGELIVRIADNGVGFDVDGVTSGYNKRGSLGMVNMRERAALLDGTLHIESAPGHGTSITVRAPLAADLPEMPAQEEETIADIPLDRFKVASSRKRNERRGTAP